ncbi:MAG: hypothetical protein JWO13_807 [Acidobacteriales bacterium]|nr:hypothetical protein [Terriglobales bacterium]
MTKKLIIPDYLGTTSAGEFTLHEDAVTQVFALLAMRGSGKSNWAAVMMEIFASRGDQFVTLDPPGAHHGIRARADKDGMPAGPSGLQVLLVGGEHGDIPLDPNGGKELAQLVMETKISCVIDLKQVRLRDRRTFICAFAEELYARNKTPLHLFLEEADELIPQQIDDKDEMPIRRILRSIIKGGRSSGLGATIITQRPEMVDKTSLYQIDNLIAMSVWGKKPIKAITDWFDSNDDADAHLKEIRASLPKLQPGSAWFVSPKWLKTTVQVQARQRVTFHAGRTPKRGEQVVNVKYEIAQVADLFKAKMQERGLQQQQERDTLADLRTQVTLLTDELASTRAAARPSMSTGEINNLVDAATTPLKDTIDALLEDGRSIIARTELIGDIVQGMHEKAGRGWKAADDKKALLLLPSLSDRRDVPRIATPINDIHNAAHSTVRKHMPNGSADAGDVKLPSGAVRILQVLAQWQGKWITGGQLRAQAGLKKSGTYDEYLRRLKAVQFIEQSGNQFRATAAGVQFLGADIPRAPRTTREVLDLWEPKIPTGARKILRILVDRPREYSPNELAEAAGFSGNSGTFGEYTRRLVSAGLVVKHGSALAANRETLFL